MHLKAIKLAGFKTFATPTQIHLYNQPTAVVGPNGCGKSNLMDAVCWVLGEASHKKLRSEIGLDVLFNGNATNPPAHRAVVELLFDNQTNDFGKRYATYNQISVKRELDRTEVSQYFINNQKVRRKDVVDLFIGTGLGPQSYALIQQGMVNDLVEAKPEVLKQLFEEAAQISKYRHRRHESELKLERTCQNLERVGDIEREVAKQHRQLKKEARQAEKAKELAEAMDEVRLDIAAGEYQLKQQKWDEAQLNRQKQLAQVEQNQSRQSQIIAQMDKLALKIQREQVERDKLREKSIRLEVDLERIETQNLAKQKAQNAQMQSLKDAHQLTTSQKEQATQRLHQSQAELAQVKQSFKIKQKELDVVNVELEHAKKNWNKQKEQLETLRIQLTEKQAQQRAESQIIAQVQNQAQAQAQTQASLLKQLNQNLEEVELSTHTKTQGLASLKKKGFEANEKIKAIETQIENLEEKTNPQSEEAQKHLQAKSTLTQHNEQKEQQEQAIQKLELALTQLDTAISKAYEKIKSQTHALAQNQPSFAPNFEDLEKWFATRQIKPSWLMESVSIEKQWQLGVEAVLPEVFATFDADGFESFETPTSNRADEAGETNAQKPNLDKWIRLLNRKEGDFTQALNKQKQREGEVGLKGLQSVVVLDKKAFSNRLKLFGDFLNWRLLSIFISDDLAQARTLLGRLKPYESILVCDEQKGVFWLTMGWEMLIKSTLQGRQTSFMQKKEVLKAAEKELRTLKLDQEQKRQELNHIRNERLAMEAKLVQAQKQALALQNAYEGFKLEQSGLKHQLEQLRTQAQAIKKEVEQAEESLANLAQRKKQTQDHIHQIESLASKAKVPQSAQAGADDEDLKVLEGLERLEEQFKVQQKQCGEAENHYSNLEEKAKTSVQQLESLKLQDQALTQQIKQGEVGLLSIQKQHHQQSLKLEQLKAEIKQEAKDEGREGVEKKRQGFIAQIKHLQVQLNQFNHTLTQLENQSHDAKQSLREVQVQAQGLQQTVQKIELEQNTLKVQKEGLVEQISSQFAHWSDEEVMAKIQSRKPQQWQDADKRTLETKIEQKRLELNHLKVQKEKLGAISYLSIDEEKAVQKRLVKLREQIEDISESMVTLKQAIGEIDDVSSQRLDEVFGGVLVLFEKNFKLLFGGGRVSLQKYGDHWLDSKIELKVAAPGKPMRSSSALSGGEKSLLALALIFSFFELNPAPFCFLDEVDAPLDDANVEKLMKMVSKDKQLKVQFVFITHNKITMQSCDNLIGVTMREPSVSQAVSVSLEKASEWAN